MIYNKLSEFQVNLPKFLSSEFEIIIDDQTYTKERMCNKKFNSLYNCLDKSSNSTTIDFVK